MAFEFINKSLSVGKYDLKPYLDKSSLAKTQKTWLTHLGSKAIIIKLHKEPINQSSDI